MPLLTGLTETGAEVPVQVKPDGRLVAEGLMGPIGPVGETGPVGPIGPEGPAGSPGIADQPKAWVNFNGSGTVAIRASYNVSSITDNGAGDYTVNFATALADANYASVATCEGSIPLIINNSGGDNFGSTVNGCRFLVRWVNIGGGNYPHSDSGLFSVVIFR